MRSEGNLPSNAIKMLAEKALLIRTSDPFHDNIVPSPCLSICKMDVRMAYCEGCFRTMDEIEGWGQLDNAAKRMVWQRLETRLP